MPNQVHQNRRVLTSCIVKVDGRTATSAFSAVFVAPFAVRTDSPLEQRRIRTNVLHGQLWPGLYESTASASPRAARAARPGSR